MPYKNKKQYRLPGYDYSLNSSYHITVVTKDRVPYFGQISVGRMCFSDIGIYAESNFAEIAERIKHLDIEEHIVMPDHIHMIITIVGTRLRACSIPGLHPEACSYPTGLQPLQKNSIGSFMNHFKGKIKDWCNKNNHPDFEWQARFHDRIIRDQKEYDAIAEYIRNNVLNWKP